MEMRDNKDGGFGGKRWCRNIMAMMVEVEMREWREVRMRETEAAVH